MSTAIFESSSKSDLKLLIEVAKKMNIKTRILKIDELEDICMAGSIENGKTGMHVNTEKYLKKMMK